MSSKETEVKVEKYKRYALKFGAEGSGIEIAEPGDNQTKSLICFGPASGRPIDGRYCIGFTHSEQYLTSNITPFDCWGTLFRYAIFAEPM